MLNCSIEHIDPLSTALLWNLVHGEDNVTTISRQETIHSRYEDKYAIEGEYNLVIKDVTVEDAVKYHCTNDLAGFSDVSTYVNVIVFG